MEMINVIQIPARSGSQRIKDKNIVDVCGLPLMAYTILLAKQLKGIDHVIVNTDSEHYAAIAREFGAETPFLRPKELATSTASMQGAHDMVKEYFTAQGVVINKLIEMYVTSPFRNLQTIQGYVDELDWRAGLTTCHHMDIRMLEMQITQKGETHPISTDYRAAESSFVKPIGTFLASSRGREAGDRFVLIKSPFELIDIDTEQDLSLMQDVVETGIYDFGMQMI